MDVTADNNVYEAYYYGKMSIQDLSISDHQDEDCLYLNIYKADDASKVKKPVMVWIHGGAFVAGGTGIELFDCTKLVKENPDVIFVTIAYRLSVLGFLHLSHLPDGKDYPDAQNLGLLDQLMALKWVHENIAGFGGDPDNVTIWGKSAGAASVTMQPLIKGSQQYFKKVIAQSGAPSQTNSMEESIATTNDFMEALGCKTVADLMKLDARTLVDTAAQVIALRIFPVRDGRILPLDLWAAYESGAAKDISFLQGCNKDEMNCFVADWTVEVFKAWATDRKTKNCHQEMIEGRQYDATFGKTMRKMWGQFAKTGNPSLSADISPDGKAKEWPLYDLKDKQVMVLDEFDIHPAKESEVKIVDWERSCFLTKYYML